jgi:hypothetical protein
MWFAGSVANRVANAFARRPDPVIMRWLRAAARRRAASYSWYRSSDRSSFRDLAVNAQKQETGAVPSKPSGCGAPELSHRSNYCCGATTFPWSCHQVLPADRDTAFSPDARRRPPSSPVVRPDAEATDTVVVHPEKILPVQ